MYGNTGVFIVDYFGFLIQEIIKKIRLGFSDLKPFYNEIKRFGGEGGIRTLEGLASLQVFKTCAFNRSATSPKLDTEVCILLWGLEINHF
jgi:hypothetical protein